MSLYLIDLRMPFVIHDELYLYLLNVTNLYGICLTFTFFKYIHEYVYYLDQTKDFDLISPYFFN